jgi:hypothetical protein
MAGLRDLLQEHKRERQRAERERWQQAEANAEALVRRLRDTLPVERRFVMRDGRRIAFRDGRIATRTAESPRTLAAMAQAVQGIDAACSVLRAGFASLDEREAAAAKRERFMVRLTVASVALAALGWAGDLVALFA